MDVNCQDPRAILEFDRLMFTGPDFLQRLSTGFTARFEFF
jgi:hypothetical protein